MKNNPVSFDDTETAFKSKTDNELRRAYWLFKLISYNWLVKVSPVFLRFALWAKLPVKGIIRATAFRHFCGGETIAECDATIKKLAAFHIGTILDYSVEGKESEDDFRNSLQETLATIKRAKGDRGIPFCVFKPSGFIRFSLLEKKSMGSRLDSGEEKEYNEFLSRIDSICSSAFENSVPVFIDAEESWIQDAVDDLAREMMLRYNKKDAIVYNTIQMYRTGRVDFLNRCIKDAKENGYRAGFKIVRGAYMEKERKRASETGVASPIQPDKESTDRDYNAALEIVIRDIESMGLCCGTHNEESSLLLVRLMNEQNVAKNHRHVWFSQLYGMSDHISYNLSKNGYNVCKYVPYGPVESVLPYLIRRAQENTSVAGQTGRELSLIDAEMKRRKVKR